MRIYKTDGTIEQIALGKKAVTLEQLQAAVGGYIEPIPGTNGRAFFNEEGTLQNLPVNVIASERFGMVIVGDVVELDKGDKQ